MAPDESVAPGGVALSEHQRWQVSRLVHLLQAHNARLNLVAAGDIPRLAERHIGDSLSALAITEFGGKTVVDIGSGAGLPGLPLAIAAPNATVTCVERIRKKAAFIKLAVADLGLPNVRVEWGDSGDILKIPRNRSIADIVTIRAVAETSKALALAHGFLTGTGCVLLWQTHEQFEREALPANWYEEWFPSGAQGGHLRGIRKVQRCLPRAGCAG